MSVSHIRPVRPSIEWDINLEDCMPIRQKVLGSGRPIDALYVPGDATARHVGMFVSDTLVGCLSLFDMPDRAVQLRKFAVLPEMQGRGVGSFALKAVLERYQNDDYAQLFLDARLTAIRFYERQGLVRQGVTFFKGDIAYIRMQKYL